MDESVDGAGWLVFAGIIIGASLGALGALLSIPGFPLWSVCVFSLNVLVGYGLTAYGGHQPQTT